MVLVIREDEARIFRQIADVYLGADGPPKGLKAIVNHLNERGITRRRALPLPLGNLIKTIR